MEKQLITNELLLAFSEYLQSNERAPGTIEKYLRDVSAFRIWLGNRSVTKSSQRNGRRGCWKTTTRQ